MIVIKEIKMKHNKICSIFYLSNIEGYEYSMFSGCKVVVMRK